MVSADSLGGRQRYLHRRTALIIMATLLMAEDAGGTYVELALRLRALGMAHSDAGGSQRVEVRT